MNQRETSSFLFGFCLLGILTRPAAAGGGDDRSDPNGTYHYAS